MALDNTDASDLAELEQIDGVTAVSVLFFTEDSAVLSARDAQLIGFTDVPGTPFVDFEGELLANDPDKRTIAPSSITSAAGLAVAAVLAHTDGSVAAVERARTWLETSQLFDLGFVVPGTRADAADLLLATLVNSFATLAYLGVGIATFIAGVSLAVATAGAILDRRRVLGLLRLTGMPGVRDTPDRHLRGRSAAARRRAVRCAGFAGGMDASHRTDGGGGSRTLGWPDPLYYLALGGSLLLAIGAVTATFGTIRRNTAIASTRFE